MGMRRQARETALKILYEVEYHQVPYQKLIERMGNSERMNTEGLAFLNLLLNCFVENKSSIDKDIEKSSDHWKITRMPKVDRNILRLGITELKFIADIPKSVTINEYLEIAKKYGTEDSSGFINGVLDKFEK